MVFTQVEGSGVFTEGGRSVIFTQVSGQGLLCRVRCIRGIKFAQGCGYLCQVSVQGIYTGSGVFTRGELFSVVFVLVLFPFLH